MMQNRKRTAEAVQLIGCALALLLSGCSSNSESPQYPPPSDPDTSQTTADDAGTAITLIDEVLADLLGDSPGGLSVLLRRNGASRTSSAGVADAQGSALAQNSTFRVGSLSKPIVATLVMQLVEEGQVELDRPLADYLPETTVGHAASVRDLLAHRAGVANYTEAPGFIAAILADRSREFTPAEILDFVTGVPRETSGNFAYSNTHYILLGQLIEAFDGNSLQDSLERRISSPLGLDSTRFVMNDGQQPESLVPAWSAGLYEGRFDTPYTSISSSAWAAGALVSNVSDLEKFLDALLDGTLVQPATLDQMMQFGADGYGLGMVDVMVDSTSPAIGHSGEIPGYTATMAMTTDRSMAVIVLTNNEELNPEAVAHRLLAIDSSGTAGRSSRQSE